MIDGTHEKAECAAHTIGLADPGLILTVVRKKIDALVRPVLAGDMAQVTLDAF